MAAIAPRIAYIAPAVIGADPKYGLPASSKTGLLTSRNRCCDWGGDCAGRFWLERLMFRELIFPSRRSWLR
jgi:hypothetical protein